MAGREVPIEPLREAFLRSGMTATEVALRLGWMEGWKGDGRWADGHRVKRALGIKPRDFGPGYGLRCNESTTYERAVMLARAMGVDPVDLGL